MIQLKFFGSSPWGSVTCRLFGFLFYSCINFIPNEIVFYFTPQSPKGDFGIEDNSNVATSNLSYNRRLTELVIVLITNSISFSTS